MENKKKLIFAIAKYLKEEMSCNTQEDESLEVAIQCLENAFGISVDDSTLDVGVSLPEVFNAILKKIDDEKAPVSEEAKAQADEWKTKGNELIKVEKYQEAIDCYSKAISINNKNPVYYCNRALAYSRLNNPRATINDCKTAIQIEPNYSKAYDRMGTAYVNLSMFEEARSAFAKAIELEPENVNYRNNSKINEEKLERTRLMGSSSSGAEVPNIGDYTSMLGNQRVMSMASQMLSDPSMQSMLNNLIGGNAAPGGGGMDGLLQAGQRLAQMMQSTNPDLVEQLRQQVQRGGDPPPAP